MDSAADINIWHKTRHVRFVQRLKDLVRRLQEKALPIQGIKERQYHPLFTAMLFQVVRRAVSQIDLIIAPTITSAEPGYLITGSSYNSLLANNYGADSPAD
jgi:hypothetical protein